jgi:hypothetical protein
MKGSFVRAARKKAHAWAKIEIEPQAAAGWISLPRRAGLKRDVAAHRDVAARSEKHSQFMVRCSDEPSNQNSTLVCQEKAKWLATCFEIQPPLGEPSQYSHHSRQKSNGEPGGCCLDTS